MRRKHPPQWDVYCCSCSCPRCAGRDVYVGTAKWGMLERYNAHLRSARKIIVDTQVRGPQAFHHFIAKHGVENTHLRLLQSCDSREEMYASEVTYIEQLRTLTAFGGMNVHRGGKGGKVSHSSETRAKMSDSMKAFHEANPSFRDISNDARTKWLDVPGNASLRAKLAWISRKRKMAQDPEFAAKQHEAAVKRGKAGKSAQLAHRSSV